MVEASGKTTARGCDFNRHHAPLSLYDLCGLDTLARQQRLDRRALRQLHNNWLKRFHSDDEALADFPDASAIARLSLKLFRRSDSAVDGATKLLFQTSAGLLIESVILRLATGRTTLCVSSQVGCAAACAFCATGKMGFARNLSADDILDQVLRAGQLLAAEGRAIRNVVFMGMGEPFHNERNLHTAIEALLSPRLFHLSPAKILVSTVGVADGMIRVAERFARVNLALSLHSVRPAVRERLIPLAARYPLDLLRQTIERLNRDFDRTVMIEYLMLAGVNDSAEDARELVAWLQGLAVHVNLIPYNPIAEAPELVGSDLTTCKAFADALKSAGFKTTIRHSLGNDIAAACGQLVRHENLTLLKTR